MMHFKGWNKYYDEILPITSPRLSPLGLYTNRDDIPRYEIKNNNAMKAQIINKISDLDDEQMPPPEQVQK